MEKKRLGRRKGLLLGLLIVIVVLVIIRLALPSVVLNYANKRLSSMPGYHGHIRDIDIAIIRGAYKIDSIYLNKIDSTTNKETPFFAASTIDLSIEWRALIHGSIVGEAVFINPKLRFTKDKVEPKNVRKDSTQFKKLKHDFMPLQVNRFEVQNGRIEYIDEHSSPPVDLVLTHASILATNLRNSYDSSSLLPAIISAHATAYEGRVALNMKINPMAENPTFDLNAEIKNTNLAKLNDFFKAYAKADVSHGNFGLYTEIAAKDGKFKGYVKPVIKDLKVLGPEDKKDNILQKAWEGFAGTIGQAFKNQSHDRLATKIPFEGNIENPKANVWYAIVGVLQNAFVRALQPSIDQDINIATLDKSKKDKSSKNLSAKENTGSKKKKNFFQRLFGKKEKAKGGKQKVKS